MTKRQGIFITFEGVDGCGKSTQAKMLYQYLKKSGYRVLLLREPGGTPVSEKVRRILLDSNNNITSLTELYLYEAARSQLASQMILPALGKGQIVICDRFYDSTTAYQGYGRGIDLGFIKCLNREAARNRAPDLTFIFDVDYRTSMSRRKRKPDRLERETKAFFNSVRNGFKELAHRRGTVMLDGCLDIDSLFDMIRERSFKLITRKKDSIVR